MASPRADLASFTFLSKYARFRPDLGRRETFEEAVDRMCDMHLTKFHGNDYVHRVMPGIRQALKDRRILGSQRTLQFGGEAILRKELRQYNCSYSHFDRPRFLAEAVWLLLCGCGVGFSVQKQHVAKLPPIQRLNGSRTHIVDDSIEGWADAFDALFRSYVDGSERVSFDYSQIRPEGAALSTSSSKAPGPKPLRDALEFCRAIFDRCVGRPLDTIDAYDLVVNAATCVRAGGIRRSATIALFSPDDRQMMTAKTGNWFEHAPNRRLSNNSAILDRLTCRRDEFDSLMESTAQFGEPGFYFTDDIETGTNPCQRSSAPVLTPDGLRTFADIDAGSLIWSASGWTRVLRKWSTGVKPVKRYRTTAGCFESTENHRIVSNGVKVEAKDAESIDICRGPKSTHTEFDRQAIIDGLVCGDGTWHNASPGAALCVGGKDIEDYADFFGSAMTVQRGVWYHVPTTLGKADLPKLPMRRVPEKYRNAKPNVVCSFLRGLYSANGSIVGGSRITLKTASQQMRDDVQMMLSSVGIRSYYTTNRAHDVEFSNGTYRCAESYDINISSVDRRAFVETIGFIHKYKNDKASLLNLDCVSMKGVKESFEVVAVEELGEEEVFDITVDNDTHTYWSGGFNVSNCGEIGLDPVISGTTAWAFCNLTTVNCAQAKTKARFLDACYLAGILGTIQAAYTDCGYLGTLPQRIMERDALLGVSLTGIADNLDAMDWLEDGVRMVRQANEEAARALGIETAARLTCIKPEGTGSLVLGVGNGIHPHHSMRYLRYVEGGKASDPLVVFMRQKCPEAVVQSAYNPEEFKIIFPIALEGEPWLKENTPALAHLDMVRTAQEKWVKPGTNRGHLHHNVSNTVVVKPDEWKAVADFIWNNRASFAGVALLGSSGDLDYPQAPFVAVQDEATEALFNRLMSVWPDIDWTELKEADGSGVGGTEVVACAGGACSF